jgi:N-acetylglutamate synthase-like GNAT family acetyltransferase
MSYKIRRAGLSDIHTLVDIIRNSFADVAVRFNLTPENCPKHPSNCQADWIDSALKNNAEFYLLESSGVPAGCVALEKPTAELCYLERLGVLPSHRGNGFGGALVQHAVARARVRGVQRVSVGVIADHVEVKKWYQKIGFKETRKETFPHLPFEVAYMEKSI